jgi:hypothetical protein
MKRIINCLFLICLLFPQVINGSHPIRTWKGDPDDGTIHALGNGQLLAYEQGPHIIHLFPGPFSTPSFYKVFLKSKVQEVQSTREKGTAIWNHEIILNGMKSGQMTDFVDRDIACLIRHIETSETLSFEIVLKDYVKILKTGKRFEATGSKGSVLLQVPSGTNIYQTFAYPRIIYHQIAWQGAVSLSVSDENPHILTLSCAPGTCSLFFLGGPEYPQVIKNTEEVFSLGFENLRQRTRAGWHEFTGKRIDFNQLISSDLPQREKLLRVIDDVAVMIKTQQAVQGSVMAGYPYPLGYVRDQYGVSRGLLALGCHAEARAILDFYWQIWKKSGKIHNAQTIGLEALQFHIHENDEVESPGYLIIQAFDFLQKTGDKAFIGEIFPMLKWAFEVQKTHLIHGMLPFNGDETYIAGGLLPRTVLNDGSAESTLLFIDGGEKLLSWISVNKLWDEQQLAANRKLLQETKSQYMTNFWKNGHLLTNNPSRAQIAKLPRFRHGVCERSGPDCLVFSPKGFTGITWTERDSNGRYQCANCLALGPFTKVEPKIYDLVSVSLTPVYFHSELFKPEQLKPVVNGIIEAFYNTGKMPGASRSVGYEFGLVLYAATRMGDARADYFYNKTLSLADSAGAWSEYYLEDKPQGTRYRPWESAINLEALINWASREKNRK